MQMKITAPEAGSAGSEELTEVTVMSWKKKDGDCVARGETLCEVEFGKAVVEVEAAAAGRLKIDVNEGEMVPAGATLGYIRD